MSDTSVISSLLADIPAQQIKRDILISLKNSYVFFPIGKVANTSIKLALFKLETDFQRPIRSELIHDPNYSPLLRPHYFGLDSPFLARVFSDEYFKFTFVRRPYERILSAYLDRLQSPNSHFRRLIFRNAEKLGINRDKINFLNFLKTIQSMKYIDMDSHIRPQYNQIGFDSVKFDFIGKFENLKPDFDSVVRKIYGTDRNASIDDHPATKTNAARHLSTYYNQEEMKIVENVYVKDFESFDYERL